MLKDFEAAVRQFQVALADAGITGDVEMTLPREPMLKMHHEWLAEPVFRCGPLPVDFERSVFHIIAPGGTWTIRHPKKPETRWGLP